MLLTDARRAARTGRRRLAGPAGRAGSRAGRDDLIARGHRADHRHAPARAARPVPAPGGDRRRPRRGAAPRRPTGRRCSRSTSCSSASRRTRWSRSTARWRVAMVHGPRAGLDLLATLDDDERLAGHHRLASVRAHLLELAGDTRGRPRDLQAGRAADDEPSRAAPSRAARGAAECPLEASSPSLRSREPPDRDAHHRQPQQQHHARLEQRRQMPAPPADARVERPARRSRRRRAHQTPAGGIGSTA